MEEIMKTRIWIYIKNLGDGSASIRFFSSKEEAEKYAENDDERFCDDINEYILDFDSNGELLDD